MSDISELKFRPRQLTNMFTAIRPGRYELKAALGAVTTYKGFFTVQAADYLDITALIPNIGPAYTAKISYSLCSATGSDDVIAVTPPGGAWSAGQSFTVAAGGTAAGLNSETVVFSQAPRFDKHSLARTDSPTRARAVIAWMLQVPSGTQMSVPNLGSYYWWFENNIWPQAKVTMQAVAGVDTPSSFTTTARQSETAGVQPFHIGFKYTSTKWGRQLYIGGDSIVEGLGGNPRWMGAVQRSACILSTPENPIEWFNGGQHAQFPDVYMAEMTQNLDMVRPTAVFFSPYSVNAIFKSATSPGLSDSSKKDEVYRAIATASRLCGALPRPPSIFVLEALPNMTYYVNPTNSNDISGTTTGANDALRLALNTELTTMGNDATPLLTPPTGVSTGVSINRQGITVIKGLAAAYTDPTASTGGQLVPRADAIGTDRIHPNEVGFSTYLEPVVRPYVAAC